MDGELFSGASKKMISESPLDIGILAVISLELLLNGLIPVIDY